MLVGNERQHKCVRGYRPVTNVRARADSANAILPNWQSGQQITTEVLVRRLPIHVPTLLVVIVPGRASWPLKCGQRHQYSLSCARCGIRSVRGGGGRNCQMGLRPSTFDLQASSFKLRGRLISGNYSTGKGAQQGKDARLCTYGARVYSGGMDVWRELGR
jgi:hypothetical protein